MVFKGGNRFSLISLGLAARREQCRLKGAGGLWCSFNNKYENADPSKKHRNDEHISNIIFRLGLESQTLKIRR